MTVKEELLALAERIEQITMPLDRTVGYISYLSDCEKIAAELRRIADGLGDLPDTEWGYVSARSMEAGWNFAHQSASEEIARTLAARYTAERGHRFCVMQRTIGPWLPVEDTEQ